MDKAHGPKFLALVKGSRKRVKELSIAPDLEAPIVLYCGGGYRSALAADNLRAMGYRNVSSMWGGWRGWTVAGYPCE